MQLLATTSGPFISILNKENLEMKSRDYGSRPLITSKPGSSPPERPFDSGNITSPPWSDANCLRTTTPNTLSCLFRQNPVKKAEIRQPWVINRYNTHTPDSRKACKAIAFYDNFTPQKSRPIKIEPSRLSVA